MKFLADKNLTLYDATDGKDGKKLGDHMVSFSLLMRFLMTTMTLCHMTPLLSMLTSMPGFKVVPSLMAVIIVHLRHLIKITFLLTIMTSHDWNIINNIKME